MGFCKDCRKWDRHNQTCDVEWVYEPTTVKEDGFAIYAQVDDDTGLDVRLITGPLFSCSRFWQLECL